jgi:hypothetical protein
MGCRFILLRETRKTRRLYAEILKELKNPRRLHEADMQRILRRIDDMNTKLTAALTALGTSVSALAVATDAETGKLASIEEQLRNSNGLSNDETNDLADQISSITGTITASTSKLTNSLSDVHDAAGGSGASAGIDQGGASQGSGSDGTSGISDGFPATGSDGGQAAGGGSSGSGSESGGVAGSAGSPTPTDPPAGSGSGDQPQGSGAPQYPPQG